MGKATRGAKTAPGVAGRIDMGMGDVIKAEAVLGRLMDVRGLPQRTAYDVAKIARLVAAEATEYRRQQRDLVKDLGQERPTQPGDEARRYGRTMFEITDPEKIKTYNEAMERLEKITVAIEWTPLAFTALAGADLSARDIEALGPLLAEPEASA